MKGWDEEARKKKGGAAREKRVPDNVFASGNEKAHLAKTLTPSRGTIMLANRICNSEIKARTRTAHVATNGKVFSLGSCTRYA